MFLKSSKVNRRDKIEFRGLNWRCGEQRLDREEKEPPKNQALFHFNSRWLKKIGKSKIVSDVV